MEGITEKLKDLVGADNVSVKTRRATPKTTEDGTNDRSENGTSINVKDDAREVALEYRIDAEKPANAAQVEPSGGFTCDRCDMLIKDVRMSCQSCSNFDYCGGCFTDAKTIHPGHGFKPMLGRGPAPPGNDDYTIRSDFAAMKGKQLPLLLRGDGTRRPDHICRSCRALTETFALWHHLIADASDEDSRIARLKGIQQKENERTWKVRVTSLAEATALGYAFCSYFLKKLWGPEGGIAFSYRAKRPWFHEDIENHEERVKVMKRAMFLSSKLKNDEFVFRIKPFTRKSLQAGGPWLEKVVFTAIGARCDQSMIQECFGPRSAVSFELLAFAGQNNAAAKTAEIAPNPASGAAESLLRARTWLTTCQNDYGPSCFAANPPLPTRVLDVSRDDQCRIIGTPADMKEAYCSVSYQWGGPQEFQLTSSSLQDLKNGFASKDLPKTIADAVRVTQAFGVRYLWVDALCILQDSSEDKLHEISHMEDIYRRATVTIIAASSTSASSGFLTSKKPSDPSFWRSLVPLRHPVIKIPADDEQNDAAPDVQWVQLLFMDDMEAMDYGVTKNPVTSRSWCLQERLVSPRILNYGRWPTWRCNKLSKSDGGFYISSDPQINKADEFARLLGMVSRRTSGTQVDHFMLEKLLMLHRGDDFCFCNKDQNSASIGLILHHALITILPGLPSQQALSDLSSEFCRL